ncbi:MAG: M23 family metallopeptidase [Desulfuromonadales bacterium]|nr:M23 family metallopeptidase [Desulfuromonadales bacterium]
MSLLVAALAVGGFFYLRDTSAPQIALNPEAGPVSAKKALLLDLQDSGSGLKELRVTVVQGEKTQEILNKSFDAGTIAHQESLVLSGAGLKDGPLELRVSAGDRSIYSFGRGNRVEQSFTLEYDSKPPTVAVVSTAHNLNQGGAGLIIYTVSEEPAKSGVQVGELFFPGFRQQGDTFACFFAFPWNMSAAQFTPRLVNIDQAGNERISGFYHHVNARSFPRDRIEISNNFLESKMPEFQEFYPETSDLLQLFLKVNGEMRGQNVQALLEIGRNTSPRPLWKGGFVRQLGAPRGHFAQGRTYHHNGAEIDQATHLGVDIAGLAQMPVVAANGGRVVFADYLGIYGNTIIIDHGLGLQSLYAHLSQMSAAVGDTVDKGQEIARSGASGMAGGDHLHFGMLISGLEVVPLEWWDENWIKNNISGKLAEIPGGAPL